MSELGTLLPLIAIVLAFWLLILRPARKRQVQAQQLQSSLAVGNQVMLTSGLYGRVVELGEETIRLPLAPTAVVTAHRQAVARVVEPDASDYPGGTAGMGPAAETADPEPRPDTDPADDDRR